MTRLQQKCIMFSACLHGLLLVILVVSSAFSDKPDTKEMVIMTMIPSNIVDKDGANARGPGPTPTPAPAPAPTLSQPTPPVVQQPLPKPAPQPVAQHQEPARTPVEHIKPKEITHERVEPVIPDRELTPAPKPVKKHPTHEHEVVPSYTPAKDVAKKQTSEERAAEAKAEARAAAKADARRRKAIERGLGEMAKSVEKSAAQKTVVDTSEVGGGEAFAGYVTAIFNAYYHAWSTPDSVANRMAFVDVKIVVARDGSILSAEVVRRSGDRSLDNSVERALREVRTLPPFPSTSTDQQRSFTIRFNLEAKEGAG